MKLREKPRLWGTLEGEVWISDDFNDSFELVSESEKQLLETVRANNQVMHKNELRKAAV